MQKPIYLFIIFIFCIVLYSCQKSNQVEFSSFPESYDLKGEKVNNGFYFKAGIVEIYDSILVLHSTPEKSECIHLFNKNTFKHITSTGKIGSGPGEITNIGLGCMDRNKGILWYRDMGRKIMWNFNIAEIMKDSIFMPVERISLPKDEFFIDFDIESKNLFSFSNPDQDVLISFFNENGEVVDSLAIYNKIKVYKKLGEMTRMYTSTYLYKRHPSKNYYAIAFRMADVLAIINSHGKVIKKVYGPGKVLEEPEYGNYNYKETNEHIVVSNDFIYCLYLGVKKLKIENGETKINYPKQINVYNWEGNPIAQFKLEYSVTTFDIDFEKNRLVTISPETGGFIFYKLPEL